MAKKGELRIRDAAIVILYRHGKPLQLKDISDMAIKDKLITTSGKTPQRTIGANLYTDIKKKGKESLFCRTGEGEFDLTGKGKEYAKNNLQDYVNKRHPQNKVKIKTSSYNKKLSYKDAAVMILYEHGKSLHFKEITDIAIKDGIIETSGKTPDQTLGAHLYSDIKKKGKESLFSKVGEGEFDLTSRGKNYAKNNLQGYVSKRHSPEKVKAKTSSNNKELDYKNAAAVILYSEEESLKPVEITDSATSAKILNPKGKTPDQTMSSTLLTHINKNGAKSLFMKDEDGRYRLTKRGEKYAEENLTEHIEKVSGILYVLSNESMDEYIKVGITHNLQKRMEDLFNTSVPTRFKLEYAFLYENPRKKENVLKRFFKNEKVPTREFYKKEILDDGTLYEMLVEIGGQDITGRYKNSL